MAARLADVHGLKGEGRVTDQPREAENCGRNLRCSAQNAVRRGTHLRGWDRIAHSRHVLTPRQNLDIRDSVFVHDVAQFESPQPGGRECMSTDPCRAEMLSSL